MDQTVDSQRVLEPWNAARIWSSEREICAIGWDKRELRPRIWSALDKQLYEFKFFNESNIDIDIDTDTNTDIVETRIDYYYKLITLNN